MDLLGAVCESLPLPTGEVLQDISIIFAKLGRCFYVVITIIQYQREYGSATVATSPVP